MFFIIVEVFMRKLTLQNKKKKWRNFVRKYPIFFIIVELFMRKLGLQSKNDKIF